MGTVPKLFVTMNYVSWFSVIFVIASYIRLYPKQLYKSTRLWGRLTLLVLAIDILSIIACAWLSAKTGKTLAYAFVKDSNTFLAVVTSICAFLFFKNLKIPYSKFINTVASTCFGVLLIHANSDTMRRLLWQDLFDCVGHYSSRYMPLLAVGDVLLVFAVCTIIDLIRIRLFEEPFFAFWDAHWGEPAGGR